MSAVGSTVVTTDQGAVQAGADIARQAIGSGEANLDVVTEFAKNAQNRSLDVAESALSDATGTVQKALDQGTGLARDTLYTGADLAKGFADESRGLVNDVVGQVDRQGQAFIQAVDTLQARESTNTDARLQDITQKVIYLGGAAIVVAFAVGYLNTRRRAA